MSAPSASCRPPPNACPRTAAMTGTGRSYQASTARWPSERPSAPVVVGSSAGRQRSPAAIAENAVRSRPAQNDRPAPDSTTARTAGVSASAAAVSASAVNMAMSSALSFSGRLSRTSATPSAIVHTTRSATHRPYRRHRVYALRPASPSGLAPPSEQAIAGRYRSRPCERCETALRQADAGGDLARHRAVRPRRRAGQSRSS